MFWCQIPYWLQYDHFIFIPDVLKPTKYKKILWHARTKLLFCILQVSQTRISSKSSLLFFPSFAAPSFYILFIETKQLDTNTNIPSSWMKGSRKHKCCTSLFRSTLMKWSHTLDSFGGTQLSRFYNVKAHRQRLYILTHVCQRITD